MQQVESVHRRRSRVLLTFPFGTTTVRIYICLDEPDVTLHNWADIFHPVSRTLFMSLNGTSLESEYEESQL